MKTITSIILAFSVSGIIRASGTTGEEIKEVKVESKTNQVTVFLTELNFVILLPFHLKKGRI